jgi:hypothetical protein
MLSLNINGILSLFGTTQKNGSNPAHGEVYSIQHYMIKFVIDLRQIGVRVLRFPPPEELTAMI